VDKLDKAMDGMGTDEKTIIEILCSHSSIQRMEIKKLFRSLLQEDLLLVVREELSGEFLELTLVMLRERLAFDLDVISVFLKVVQYKTTFCKLNYLFIYIYYATRRMRKDGVPWLALCP
jgi:predicted transglutaminase-like protease